MKKITLLLASLLVSIYITAQTSGGPDAYGYTWKNSNHTVSPPVYSWFNITTIGIEVTGLADDNIAGPFTASNGFQFYWYPTPKFWIGSNGYITFNGDNIASPFPASIPLSSGANNWIAPMMADLNFIGTGNTAKCYYYSNADTLCVSYHNVPFWYSSSANTGSMTFQIILNKVDKSITFNYQSMTLGSATLDNCVGIENNTGTLGLSTHIDVLPSSSYTVKYYYPSTVTYAVTDGGVNWNGNNKNGGVFVKKGAPVSLSANVKNFGNQSLGAITVRDTVYSNSGIPITNGSKNIASLAVGIDSSLTFSNTFVSPNPGIYSYNTRISGITGDMVASNDGMSQKIIAIDTTLSTMTLDYSDGAADGTGISWNGGGGGIAVYIEPPVYPCKIVSSRFYITANATTPVGFYAKIFDDNGLNGSAGTMLDSAYAAPSGITLNQYKVVPVANQNLTITSGGIYLFWEMEAATIALGRDITPPISRQTYEVLGNGWAEYRDKFSEDFLMGITISFPAPDADFSFDTTASPSVVFTDLSTNSPSNWLWNFDDNGATSTSQNPTHVFTSVGNHNVCLKSSNGGGLDSICKIVHITHAAPVANFNANTAQDPTVVFTDLTTNNPTTWKWNFDDGSPVSTVQNPTHTFTTTGIYNVCLIAANPYGSDTVCKSFTIVHSAPVANFGFSAGSMPTVSFIDLSTYSPNAWYWDFDESPADTSNLQHPTFKFKTNGPHSICLIASNQYGSSAQSCQNLNVYGTGITDLDNENSILIFPVPITEKAVIQLVSSKKYNHLEMKCYNMLGEMVNCNYTVNENRIELIKGDLQSGIYFFEIFNNLEKVGRGKFSVE